MHRSSIVLVCIAAGALCACGMLGGWRVVDDHSNNEGVEQARQAAEKYLQAQGGAPGALTVLEAHTQVVAGTNYKLKLKAGEKTYEATVWEKLPAYGGAFEVTHMSQIPSGGGTADEWQDNPEVDDAAAYAVQQLSSQSNSLFPFTLKKVLSARVSKDDKGVTHHLKLQLSHGSMPDSVYEVDVANPGGSYQLKNSKQVKLDT